MRRLLVIPLAVGLLVAAAALGAEAQGFGGPKNVILLVSDGAGFNTFNAASYFQYGELGRQPYDGFPIRFASTTYMRNEDGALQGYDSLQMWTDFNYAKGSDDYTAFTDSAAAATSLNTGVKTSRGRIGMDVDEIPLTTIAEIAEMVGKSAGAVSSVQMSHATPGSVWAHNPSRDNYGEIAAEMIYESGLEVIMGAGHPLFDDNGLPVEPGTLEHKYVGGEEIWTALKDGTTGEGWTFIEEKADFEALASGPADPPDRVIGIAQAHSTLQMRRDGSDMNPDNPFNTNVPTLATMTRAAIHVLDQNPRGFFLMVEGGAVDWANHGQNLARMVEEQIDFNGAVEAAVQWVEESSSWSETLVLVTADHECGMLWGPESYVDVDEDSYYNPEVDLFNFWNPIVNNGAGNLPGAQYGSWGHTNTLVPLYAKGMGAGLFYYLLDGWDGGAYYLWDIYGVYVDNTDIFKVMLFLAYSGGA